MEMLKASLMYLACNATFIHYIFYKEKALDACFKLLFSLNIEYWKTALVVRGQKLCHRTVELSEEYIAATVQTYTKSFTSAYHHALPFRSFLELCLIY